MKPVLKKRHTLVLTLAAMMMFVTAAAAATLLTRTVFDVTIGDLPVQAPALTQHDLAKETVGNAEITVKEAAYDGMTLYIAYGIRDLTAAEPLGEMDEELGVRCLRQEDYDRIRALGVGWWTDNLWIDGKSVSMPNMSGGEELPGDAPGEFLSCMQYRLDQENVFLDGKNVEIALPIGQRQEIAPGAYKDDPDGGIPKPEEGMITFRLDCSVRDRVKTETPNILMEGPRWSAAVSQVVYTPIRMYVTLDWAANPEVLSDYLAENGDGCYEDGVQLYPYGGLEICGGEIMNMQLVNEQGKPVFEDMQGFYGCCGADETQAWYTFPYAETYPGAMYLVPEIDGELDMTLAVKVK